MFWEQALIVGLGNPGTTYAGNRHNAGAMVADVLAARTGSRFSSHKAGADICSARIGSSRVLIAKPRSYMNLSGGPTAGLLRFYKLGIDQLVVVHDELDVPFGEIRLKVGGGEGGHNGLKSISASVGSKDYARIRFGIGRPPGRQDPADYVLSDFAAVERKELEFLVDRAADAVEAVVQRGLEWTQNAYHAA